jgi:serine/threonine protein kinase
VVYKGRWKNKTVALKELRDAEQLSSFAAEAGKMQSLTSHKNVVDFYGIGKNIVVSQRSFRLNSYRCCIVQFANSENVALVVEYCSKGALSDLLYGKRRIDITQQQQVSIALDVARGVAHLHSEAIVHRDLAARNILVDRHMMAKVGDFGMAREDAGNSNATQSSVGPVKYDCFCCCALILRCFK